jgi:hypothetical protein
LEAKFIEVQYSSQFYGPIFFHSFPQASVLFSICRESRELAFSKTMPRSEVNIEAPSSLTPFVSVPTNTTFQAAYRRKKLTATRRPSHRLLFHWGQEERDLLGISLRFNPALDTIFFRSLDQPFGKGGLLELSHHVNNVEWIQHLAVPLCSAYLPPNNEWKRAIANMRDLKTLTYVVGDMNQWVGCRYAKLRDVEEWFVDGRDTRCLECDFLCLDVKELGRYLSGRKFEQRVKASHGWRFGDEWKGINVRVVAWKSLS